MTVSEEQADAPPDRRLDRKLIEHVDIRLEAVLGYAGMTVGEFDGLAQGSVVSLDRSLNQAVDLKVNGRTIARGEIVSVGDRFAVRITEIAD